MKRRGVTSNFGTEMDVGERAVGSKLNAVVSEGSEGGDKVSRVVVKLGVVGDGA